MSASLAQVPQVDFTPRSGLRPLQAPRILASAQPRKDAKRKHLAWLFFFFFDILQFFFLPVFMYMVSYYIKLNDKNHYYILKQRDWMWLYFLSDISFITTKSNFSGFSHPSSQKQSPPWAQRP